MQCKPQTFKPRQQIWFFAIISDEDNHMHLFIHITIVKNVTRTKGNNCCSNINCSESDHIEDLESGNV